MRFVKNHKGGYETIDVFPFEYRWGTGNVIVEVPDDVKDLNCYLRVTWVNGAGSLTITIYDSPDGINFYPIDSFNVVSSGNTRRSINQIGKYLKFEYSITPEVGFEFELKASAK